MDIYLNRERLTDLAQFAVPDGHDLWPRIEQAARMSVSGMTSPRPGILSLGLSRAWTAVGILLVAATFAALGLGLAVLVLSNGHDQAPATQPEASITPTVVPTLTPVPAASSTPVVPFEDSLSSADLARFEAVPVEVQEALIEESLENGNDIALRYLRDMPDDPAPLSEILDAETQSLLDTIDEPYRRQLLLEGYPNSTVRYSRKRWLGGDLTDLEYKYGNFDMLVRGVHETLTEDGQLLPPLEETLSSTAFKRFESLDPLLQASFRQWWETKRTLSPSDAVDRFEERLLDTPIELPGIGELGLSEAAVRVLEREAEMRDYALRSVAANLVLDQEWDSGDAARLQRHIEAYGEPGGREALAHGLRPRVLDQGIALIACPLGTWGPTPLNSVVPKPFRDVHPARLVYYWPEPEDALSDAALANFNLLDETMREAFEVRWYGHGLPHDAGFMACLVAEWNRGIADTPFTSMPGPDIFLPEDKRKSYDELTDHEKWAIELNLAAAILKGEIWFNRSRFGQTEVVSTLGSTEEFLEGLRFSAVEWLCGFHAPACR